MIDMTDLMNALAVERPIFHSEADFQHALAWELHRRLPGASLRLERPVRYDDGALHVDIWVAQDDAVLAIELKYKVRALQVQVAGEEFHLTSHSAQDLGRYDFVKDIERLERVTEDRRNAVGYAILLTNDSAYWAAAGRRTTICEAFRLHEGRALHGALTWGTGASAGTMRGREAPLVLNGSYLLEWTDYSRLNVGTYGRFRYLAVQVTP